VSVAIGIDIGGTKITVALVDTRAGRVVEAMRRPTPRGPSSAVVQQCLEMTTEIASGGGPVGLAVCELVDHHGRIVGAETVDLSGVDLQVAFATIGPLVVESDVRSAAIAEARFGAAVGAGAALVISAGTGVSACLLVDGRPYRGAHGHALLVGAPPIEEQVSGAAMARRALELGLDPLADSDAMDAVRAEAGERLGVAIAWLVNALDPAIVVIGGGLAAVPRYASAAIASTRRSMEAIPGIERRIVVSSLGPDAAVIGAGLVAFEMFGGRAG
jgi:glucokinase